MSSPQNNERITKAQRKDAQDIINQSNREWRQEVATGVHAATVGAIGSAYRKQNEKDSSRLFLAIILFVTAIIAIIIGIGMNVIFKDLIKSCGTSDGTGAPGEGNAFTDLGSDVGVAAGAAVASVGTGAPAPGAGAGDNTGSTCASDIHDAQLKKYGKLMYIGTCIAGCGIGIILFGIFYCVRNFRKGSNAFSNILIQLLLSVIMVAAGIYAMVSTKESRQENYHQVVYGMLGVGSVIIFLSIGRIITGVGRGKDERGAGSNYSDKSEKTMIAIFSMTVSIAALTCAGIVWDKVGKVAKDGCEDVNNSREINTWKAVILAGPLIQLVCSILYICMLFEVFSRKSSQRRDTAREDPAADVHDLGDGEEGSPRPHLNTTGSQGGTRARRNTWAPAKSRAEVEV